jgi:hypothetical protein
LRVLLVFFEGCFGKSGEIFVVDLWTDCGELRGKRGQKTARFRRRKMRHDFQLFFG